MILQVFIEFERILHHRDVIFSLKSLVFCAYLGKYNRESLFNIPHTVHAAVMLTSHLSVFSGNCRLHLFSCSQTPFNQQHSALFWSFIWRRTLFSDCLIVSLQLLTCKWVRYRDDSLDTSSFYYCGTATDQGPPGVKRHFKRASFCFSAPVLLGIILQHLQPARRGDSIVLSPTTKVWQPWFCEAHCSSSDWGSTHYSMARYHYTKSWGPFYWGEVSDSLCRNLL